MQYRQILCIYPPYTCNQTNDVIAHRIALSSAGERCPSLSSDCPCELSDIVYISIAQHTIWAVLMEYQQILCIHPSYTCKSSIIAIAQLSVYNLSEYLSYEICILADLHCWAHSHVIIDILRFNFLSRFLRLIVDKQWSIGLCSIWTNSWSTNYSYIEARFHKISIWLHRDHNIQLLRYI